MKNAFMIAATGSGSGKTTITCALLEAIKNKNLITKAYKCGPDYIDPMFHKAVLGIESQNLDLFFSDKKELRSVFYREDACDVAVVEGVMGLFDGVSVNGNEGSSYDLACKLGISVVLVVNAHGMGRSLLAVIKGFQAMDEEKRIKAVILNQISPSYYKIVGRQIEEELNIPVVGYFPKTLEINLKSRYLGLELPGETDNLEDDIRKAADIISETVDLDRLLDISRIVNCKLSSAGNKVDAGNNKDDENKETDATKASELSNKCKSSTVRIGIARDEAFCFYYEENLRLLKKLGAELVEFSPISDTKLPDKLDGLIIGGGYPELHAEALSRNKLMLEAIKNALNLGMPSLAECGGFMYLHDEIEAEGVNYPMVGAIEGMCAKKDRLVRFGYVTIEEKGNSFFENNALHKTIRGHEFHYFDSTNNGSDGISVKPSNGHSFEAGHIGSNYWWGFAHLYYPSNTDFAEVFVEKCRKWRDSNGQFT